MNSITVRLAFSAKVTLKLWELQGVSTPVRYCVVHFQDIGDNVLQVSVHEDNIKVLRLKKLKFFKQAWNISKIYGFNGSHEQTVHIWLPTSWRKKQMISIPINNFLRYLLDNTWKDF
jgi:hypothetical protein